MTEIRPCAKCGNEHRTWLGNQACAAHSTRTGEPCGKAPNAGDTVCGSHGAGRKDRKARSAAARTEAAAVKVMRRFGTPIETTATEALLDTVKWTAGYVAWLRDKVAELETDEDLVWGLTKSNPKDIAVGNGGSATLMRGQDKSFEAKPNVWLVLLGEWSDRLVKVCAEAIKAGIEERRVRLAESQGALVADVIKRILGDLDLTPEQAAKVPEIVPRNLRLLQGGAA